MTPSHDPILAAQRQLVALAVSVPLVIVLTMLVVWLVHGVRESVLASGRVRFEHWSTEISGLLVERMRIYEQVLRGAAGFVRMHAVSMNEWRDFADGLDVQKHYPGMQSIGYAPYLRRASGRPALDMVDTKGQLRVAIPPPRFCNTSRSAHSAPRTRSSRRA